MKKKTVNERVVDVVDDASGGHDRHAIGGVCAAVRKVEMERRAADAVSSVGSVVKRRSVASPLWRMRSVAHAETCTVCLLIWLQQPLRLSNRINREKGSRVTKTRKREVDDEEVVVEEEGGRVGVGTANGGKQRKNFKNDNCCCCCSSK